MRLPTILFGERRKIFVYLVANGIGQALMAVATALLIRFAFDRLVITAETVETATWVLLPLAMVSTILLIAWLRWRANIDGEHLGQSYVHAVRMRQFRHITTIGADGARRMSKGALMLRFVGDLSALRNWVSLGLARLTVSGLAMVLSLIALIVVEPVIATSVTISIVVTGALVFAIGPGLSNKTREVRRQRGRIAALINDRILNLGVIEAFGQEQREIKRVRRSSKRLRDSLLQRARVVGLLRALSEASAGFASMCALLIGAIQVASGLATAGTVVSAMVVAGLLASRLQDLSRVYEYWNAAVIAREKLLQVFQLQPLGRSTRKRGNLPFTFDPSLDDIKFMNVTKSPVFDSINLCITPGERVAIIGANGAGKSTLLRMLCGLIEPDSGKVMLGDKEMRTQRWDGITRTFAMVSPDLPLLRGSLRLNLTYGASNVDEAEIMQVVQQCGLASLLDRLNKHLNSHISESGAGLSTGERARIALARALLAKPSVLLLDEAEANLDASARRILDKLIGSFEGTVVFTTHNIKQVARANRVLTIDAGKLTGMTPIEAVAYCIELDQKGSKHDLKLVSQRG